MIFFTSIKVIVRRLIVSLVGHEIELLEVMDCGSPDRKRKVRPDPLPSPELVSLSSELSDGVSKSSDVSSTKSSRILTLDNFQKESVGSEQREGKYL